MYNDHITDDDLRLNLYIGEAWTATEEVAFAWINGDTGAVVELVEELGPRNLENADLSLDDADLSADLLLD